MPKDRRSRDQKRKEKLAKKQQKERRNESLAYLGAKYQTEELTPTWMQTEIGIYETYVMTDRKLRDRTVREALENLIRQMRAGALPPLPETDAIEYEIGHEDELVIENIRRRWADHFATKWKPPRDKLIGVLRTILGSIEKVGSPGPQSQSYLLHIAGFLTKKLGVSVEMVAENELPSRMPEAEDELVRLGRRWIERGDREARSEFHALADDLLKRWQATRVLDACHLLIGELSGSSEKAAELIALAKRGKQTLLVAMS